MKKTGFDSLFSSNKETVENTKELKLVKLHCMIDKNLKKELDIYAINNSLKIKDVVANAINKYINED